MWKEDYDNLDCERVRKASINLRAIATLFGSIITQRDICIEFLSDSLGGEAELLELLWENQCKNCPCKNRKKFDGLR